QGADRRRGGRDDAVPLLHRHPHEAGQVRRLLRGRARGGGAGRRGVACRRSGHAWDALPDLSGDRASLARADRREAGRGFPLEPWEGRTPHGANMTLVRRSPLLLAVLTLAIPAAAEDLPANKVTAALPGLEKYVDALRDRTGVPGLAVAVVHADKVVYVRGFGVRE